MWTTPFVAGEVPDPDEVYARVRRHAAPDNEVAASVGLAAVLVKRDDLAVALESFRVYSTGVLFDLRLLARNSPHDEISDILFGGRRRSSGVFLLGVEFADGRRATANGPFPAPHPGPDAPLLSQHGGGGGGREFRLGYFLSPVPPAGPLTFYVLCKELGIAQTAVTVDATGLVEALPRVVELWPWEPEIPSPHEPEPPSFPPGSWFAASE